MTSRQPAEEGKEVARRVLRGAAGALGGLGEANAPRSRLASGLLLRRRARHRIRAPGEARPQVGGDAPLGVRVPLGMGLVVQAAARCSRASRRGAARGSAVRLVATGCSLPGCGSLPGCSPGCGSRFPWLVAGSARCPDAARCRMCSSRGAARFTRVRLVDPDAARCPRAARCRRPGAARGSPVRLVAAGCGAAAAGAAAVHDVSVRSAFASRPARSHAGGRDERAHGPRRPRPRRRRG